MTSTLPARRRFLAQLAVLAAAGAGPASAADFEVSRWPADEPAPSLQATDLAGKTWRLADLRGRAVLLNFWATWCPPCRAEMPSLQDMAAIYGPDKVVVLAINFKESSATAGRFAQASALSLPVLLDPDGNVARQWGVRVFPTTVLIDSAGQPRQRIRGEVDWSSQTAEQLIAPLLAPVPPLRT
ncbi:MAG: TlpA disulfide reductase family protein [Rhodoferax sp.]